MLTRHLFSIALIAALPTPSVIARPPSGTTNPQIAYVKAWTSGRRQLMIANEDGSGATALYNSTRILRGELAPDGTVYFWDGGRFSRIGAAGGSPQLLFDTGQTFPSPSDLSPDGASIAWFSKELGGVFRYDIASGQQQPVAILSDLLDLSFDRTGANIIFNTPVSDVDYEFRIVPASGGTPSAYGLVGRYAQFDASHRDSTLVISVNPGGGMAPYLGLWEPGMAAPVRLTDGYNGTFRCDDSAILYQRVVGGGSTIFRRSTSGTITTIAKPEAIFPSYKQTC